MKKNYTFSTLVIVLLFTNLLTAQTFVKSDATGTNDGTSWANAYTDLSDALSNSAPMDEIWVATGTYKPGGATPDTSSFFTFPHDLLLYGGFAGTETMLSERDWTANETILSGDHLDNDVDNDFDTFREDNSLHVMSLTDTVTTASTIDGFTIRNGDTSPGSASGNDRRGGGILTYGAPAIRNCLFTQNKGYFGGGFYPRLGGAAGIIIEGCIFESNRARFGGGTYVNATTATFNDCTYAENSVESRGGGIYCASNEGAMIINCSFLMNSANESRGGGIYNTGSPSTISNCTFTNNSAAASSGGAITVRSDDDDPIIEVNISNCSFNDNNASFGGAVGIYDSKSIGNINNCDFIGNNCTTLGGATTNAFGATSNFTDCTFSQNESDGSGGAIYSQNDSAAINVINCILEFNAADVGGAIAISRNNAPVSTTPIPFLTVENTIIQNNLSASQGAGVNFSGANALFKNVLLQNNSNIDAINGIGGAMYINTPDTINSVIDLINCTIAKNLGSIGSGISHLKLGTEGSSILNIQNTIFNNPDGNDYEIEAGEPTLISYGGNLSADLSMFDVLIATNDIVGEDPLFVDFDNEDYHLANGSPCIDTGIENGAPALDIEGSPRVDGIDMGAYENQKLSDAIFNLPRTLGQLDIFPNPVQDDLNFTFESSFNGDLNILITDMKGQLIMNFDMEKNTEKMLRVHNVTNLPKGVYQLTISNGEELTTKAFVK